MNTAAISKYLQTRSVAHALIGAVAVAARGHARSTLDVDFITTDERVLAREFWDALRDQGATVEVRKGDFRDPLAGVVRIALPDGTDADVVVGKYKWQRAVIERAEAIQLGEMAIPVPTTSDLILLKLFAGGHQDVSDIRSLLEGTDRDKVVNGVEEHVADLPEDAQRLWLDITST